MTGEYQHAVDSKGRIFIPAKLREDLGDIFYITISIDKCLNVYDLDNWKIFTDKVYALSYVDQRKMRPFFAYAAKCELDNQGRILIPQNLRDYAGVDKNVIIIGCGNHAEVWDADIWNSTVESMVAPDNLKAALEELNF